MRPIDADAFKEYIRNALEATKHCYPDGGEWAKAITEEFCKDIDEQPTIEQERPTGHWIVVDRPIETSAICECSQCKHRVWKYEGENVVDMWRFCPKCGAKMEEGE